MTYNTYVKRGDSGMPLKEKFLSYVEMQRSARQVREVKGPNDPATVDAYQAANQLKREVLDLIEQQEDK